MIPEITIPRKEIGSLNPELVNILRISEKIVDGKVVKNYSLLPVHFDKNGNLVTKDIYLAAELLEEKSLPAGTKGGKPPKLVCLAARNGKKLWELELDGAILSAPVIAGKWIIFGTDKNLFYVLEELY